MTEPTDFDDLGELDEPSPEPSVTGKPHLSLVTRAGDKRPDIQIVPDIHLTTTRMLAALCEDPDLYVRGGELVHVVRAEEERVGRARVMPGTPIVRSAPLSFLRDRVSQRSKCLIEVRSKTGAHWKHIPPPKDNVIAVKERGHWPGYRPLTGILETPAFKPNGHVLQTPGYDAETGYLFLPNARYADIAEAPTHDDARRALEVLRDPFRDFPYVDASHESAVLAAVLTLLARPAINGSVPAFLFDASAARSGKSLQVDCISLIATGRSAPRMTYPAEDEELEKILGGYAAAGAAIVNFDNVATPFGGAALDKVITATDKVEMRVLGRTGNPQFSWRAVVFASGNNVRCRGDMLARVLSPRLETSLENPETRNDMRYPDLRAHVRSHRMQLVASALTILRAYFCAKCPDLGVAKWGGFESWSRLIPHALVWSGAADPLGARRGLAGDQDPERMFGEAMIAGWGRLCAAEPLGLTIKQALHELYPSGREPGADAPPDGYDELRAAIEDATGTKGGYAPSPKVLGDRLRKLRARVIHGKRLVGEAGHGSVIRWRVLPAGTA